MLPEHAETFNHRGINKVTAMDTWVLFIENLQNSGDKNWPKNRVPYWFWGKKGTTELLVLSPDQIIINMVNDKKPIQPDSED